ncbi:hypothetical protein [Legionella fairfieldensis]|uniref:hypothetical protein n=1 Tax=Legionella fairfieldensis TaxID=45064 RepID=UPI00048C216A|nr:hypothetical protein [Legionella fairfieldensis]
MVDEMTLFKEAFQQAASQAPQTYANVLRLIGVVLAFSASAWAVMRFLESEAKSSEQFVLTLTMRLFKVLLALVLFTLVFKP